MPSKRDVLACLKRDELLEALDAYGLEVADRRVRDQLIDALAGSRAFQLDEWLADFSRERLKELCRALDLDDSGRAKADIVERLLPAHPARTTAPPASSPAATGRPPRKRDVLAALKRDELLEALDAYDLEVADRRVRDQLLDALTHSRAFRLDEWLADFSRDRLKELCRALDLDDSGRAKADIVERLSPWGDQGGEPRIDKSLHTAATTSRRHQVDETPAKNAATATVPAPGRPDAAALDDGQPPAPAKSRPVKSRPAKAAEMSPDQQLSWIANFIWGIADDILRDVYVRGKYRDVILPMVVLRRLDAVLEPSKQAVLDMKKALDKAGIANQEAALSNASGQAFFNASPFTLHDLTARTKTAQLTADFEAFLDGFSANVQDILDKFKFRNQIPTLVQADVLGSLIGKFLDDRVNLSPEPVRHADGSVRLPGLDNHAMGTIFEELIRRFNEENNEEAGEHFTPRDVVKLMADLIFLPVADEIRSGTYLLYDGACGTGGMLTVAEDRLRELAREHGKKVSIHLFGQEVNAETYAITKADLILKGEGAEADHFHLGSTLSGDAFPAREFDFMLSNPPYGKSWKTDLEKLGGKKDMLDPRFLIEHHDDPEMSLVTRSSDGQLLFLVNKLHKMKQRSALGSRIAEVHNGSSLFTGDAGQGESNIRRWILENDWLEAIVALPLNMFYNTGIATYVWVLSNRKPEHRRGKVQLIDATEWSKPLRKNLGKKNCQLSPEDIERISVTFLAFEETEESKIFANEAFGYWKVVVERPLRLKVDLTADVRRRFRKACAEEREEPLADLADHLAATLGAGPHEDFNDFMDAVRNEARELDVKLTARRKKLLETALAEKDEDAAPVLKKVHKAGHGVAADPLHGLFDAKVDGRSAVVEYQTDSELRDTEQVPLLEDGGIEAFIRREVLPHVPDAWIDESSVKIGYEISFPRYFYKPEPLRTLAEIRAEIEELEKETEGLLGEILVDAEVGR